MGEVADICSRYGVRYLWLFGSFGTKRFDEVESDVDLIVEFDPSVEVTLFETFLGLKGELEAHFGRPVDLVMESAVKNPFFAKEIARTKREFYAA